MDCANHDSRKIEPITAGSDCECTAGRQPLTRAHAGGLESACSPHVHRERRGRQITRETDLLEPGGDLLIVVLGVVGQCLTCQRSNKQESGRTGSVRGRAVPAGTSHRCNAPMTDQVGQEDENEPQARPERRLHRQPPFTEQLVRLTWSSSAPGGGDRPTAVRRREEHDVAVHDDLRRQPPPLNPLDAADGRDVLAGDCLSACSLGVIGRFPEPCQGLAVGTPAHRRAPSWPSGKRPTRSPADGLAGPTFAHPSPAAALRRSQSPFSGSSATSSTSTHGRNVNAAAGVALQPGRYRFAARWWRCQDCAG